MEWNSRRGGGTAAIPVTPVGLDEPSEEHSWNRWNRWSSWNHWSWWSYWNHWSHWSRWNRRTPPRLPFPSSPPVYPPGVTSLGCPTAPWLVRFHRGPSQLLAQVNPLLAAARTRSTPCSTPSVSRPDSLLSCLVPSPSPSPHRPSLERGPRTRRPGPRGCRQVVTLAHPELEAAGSGPGHALGLRVGDIDLEDVAGRRLMKPVGVWPSLPLAQFHASPALVKPQCHGGTRCGSDVTQ